jgi:acetyl esterase/lipase
MWLNDRGIAAFVLAYRLGSHGYRFPVITNDLVRAMRFVRAGSPKWGLDASRIGVMGSSAGGHLASTLLVHFDPGMENSDDPIEAASSRPDFGILCYPVISMGPLTNVGCRENLLGPQPRSEDIDFLSSELHVKQDTPPCFLWITQDDKMVKVENVLVFAAALVAQGVPMSLHIYPSGPHGIALGFKGYQTDDKRPLHPWTGELDGWLRNSGFSST